MPLETDLDRRIHAALSSVGDRTKSNFDTDKYRLAFQRSAQEKAEAVLDLLNQQTNPWRRGRPVFVSVGGADGEELRTLLNHSNAALGVLIEGVRSLADVARSTALPSGKTVEVLEGDASEKLHDAMAIAESAVENAAADYVVVTCHAVLHELFDRSDAFDALAFFSRIFQNRRVPVWFSYREPGAPEKWPEGVLLRADCSPSSLLQLAETIRHRHPIFTKSSIKPITSGDHLRVDRLLAMEVLCKLFYLDDFQHEIEERSTSVEHEQLKALLMVAIGESAFEKRFAALWSASAPSESFKRNWVEFGVSAHGLVGALQHALPVPESHSRVIAYRLSDEAAVATPTLSDDDSAVAAQISVAASVLKRGDIDTLTVLITAFGRYWIETRQKANALSLLRDVISVTAEVSPAHLFARYLCDITDLFTGATPGAEVFSEDMVERAKPAGLELLFEAERMEFARKAGRLSDALVILNSLQTELATAPVGDSNIERYTSGVVRFLVGNMLRSGGLYREARDFIEAATRLFVASVLSHSTELFHCAYARAVCDSMRGTVNLPHFAEQPGPLFATALIRITYSHAAWFTKDIPEALAYAQSAASAFREIDHKRYATRATILADLIQLWLPSGSISPSTVAADAELTHGVQFLIGSSDDSDRFSVWFRGLRPSVALGLLQLRDLRSGAAPSFNIQLPPMLQRNENGSFAIVMKTAPSLGDADEMLRVQVGVEKSVRLPLYPD